MVPVPKRYPKDQRDRAVRMVLDRLDEYPSLYAACEAIAPKLGVGSESLRRWTLQAQIDSGQRSGATSHEMVEIKALKNKVRDLEEANEIPRQASIIDARELDPLHALICQFIDGMRTQGFAGRDRSVRSRVSRAARSPHEPTDHGKAVNRPYEPLPTLT